jgi:tetratricopeptide (TPR) repeat protein
LLEVLGLFFTEYAVIIGSSTALFGAGITVVEIVFAPFRTWRAKRRGPEKVQIVNQDTFVPIPTLAPPVEVTIHPTTEKGGLLTISLDDYEDRLKIAISTKETELKSAHDEEKALLTQQIEELTRRAQNPEAALAEAQDTIRKLEDTLAREGNNIGEARMAEAREALEAGDFSIADDIFAEIEVREQLAVERAARAAFARGEIAEQEIRWADAAVHFQKAAALDPCFKTLRQSWDFYWKLGNHQAAAVEAKKLVQAAIEEDGETTESHAIAISCAGTSEQFLGNYDAAEPLYKQAIDIDKQTIGEKHPGYAIDLNNLAGLYESMGRFDEAEPLYKQAIEIDDATLGPDHPQTKNHKSNLAALQSSR